VLFVSTESTFALYCTRQGSLAYEAIERAPLPSTSRKAASQPEVSVWRRCSLILRTRLYRTSDNEAIEFIQSFESFEQKGALHPGGALYFCAHACIRIP
jgi:hypothetical protein